MGPTRQGYPFLYGFNANSCQCLEVPDLEESRKIMGKLGEEGILFRVAASGRPIASACLLLNLVMRLKNDVPVVVGPTDQDGSAFVSAEEMVGEIRRHTSFFPMDYRPDTWTRTVEARVMSAADVARFEQGLEIWGDGPEVHRPGEVEAVRGWGVQLAKHPEPTLEVTGDILGSEIAHLSFRPATWYEEHRYKL